jgi:7-carboxy-7-deazaguanine synthase
MSYSVKEIFHTLQGEGMQAGRAAVFVRFAGCNLWSGLEKDRANAVCKFCDTAFVGTDGQNGGKFAIADELARVADDMWPDDTSNRLVVCTGGEPLLQLDRALVAAFHKNGFEVAVETNGTQPSPDVIDWLCVSPKADANLILTSGDELKLVYPQDEHTPEDFEHLDFSYFLLQPKDDENLEANTAATIEYIKDHPKWRLSIQSHKILGID